MGKKTRESDNHSVIQCEKCGLKQLLPMPTVEEDKLFYDQDTQARFVHKNMQLEDEILKGLPDVVRRVNLLNNQFEDNHANISVLEIGSGNGLFLKHVSESGYDVEGIEISDTRRNNAVKMTSVPIYSYNIINQKLNKYTDKKYDAIVMFQVLEHIQSPAQFLRNAKTALKKSGIFIIEVPNVNDHLLAFCEEYNSFYWQRAHLSYYNSSILESLLRMVGFAKIDIIGVQRYSIDNAMNWLITGQPQINKPSYISREELQWIDNYYRKQLTNSLKCDTLIAIAYS